MEAPGGEVGYAHAGWVGDYEDPNTFLDLWLTGDGKAEQCRILADVGQRRRADAHAAAGIRKQRAGERPQLIG